MDIKALKRQKVFHTCGKPVETLSGGSPEQAEFRAVQDMNRAKRPPLAGRP